MIKRFSTLYVGHIELEACGLSGTPADDRRYPSARLIEVFDTAIELARAVDALGYETLWLAEHHRPIRVDSRSMRHTTEPTR